MDDTARVQVGSKGIIHCFEFQQLIAKLSLGNNYAKTEDQVCTYFALMRFHFIFKNM